MARLDRLLANLGYGSRREVQGLLRKGAVVFDGAALSDGGQLLMVANRHLPYERPLADSFGAKVKRLAEEGGYKLYEARR